MELEVKFDSVHRKIYALVEGHECVINYHRTKNDSILDFYRTYVPEALRGQKIASLLVERALIFVQEKGYKIIPSCSFVRSYIDQHPEWKKIVSPS